jgi:hypothetical protein
VSRLLVNKPFKARVQYSCNKAQQIQNSMRATSCKKRGAFADVIRPKFGKLKTAASCPFTVVAMTLRSTFGPLKFVWLKTLVEIVLCDRVGQAGTRDKNAK